MKKTQYLKRRLVLLSLLFLLSWTSQAQHMQNGGFENPNTAPWSAWFTATNAGATAVPFWTIAGTVDIHHWNHWAYIGIDSQHADLNGNGQISQTLTNLVPGVTYTVSFVTRIHDNCVTVANAIGRVTGTSGVLATSNINLASATPLHLTWAPRSFTFVADASTAVLDFRATNGPFPCGGVMLDDISVFGPCDAFLIIDTVGCDDFRFSSLSSVDYDAVVWYLDGEIIDLEDSTLHLAEGTYEICFSYFGMDTVNGGDSLFCCDRICRTLVVQGIDTITRIDTSCSINGGALQYRPCDNGHFSFYSITPMFPAMMPCNPGIVHPLPPGNYTIRRFDADSCLRLVEYLTVIVKNPDTTTCYRRLVECGPFIDPNSVQPNCPGCFNPGSGIPYIMTAPIVIAVDTNTATTTYRRSYHDPVNCKVCVFTFDIVDSACKFTPQLSAYYTSWNPYEYQLNQLFPLTNLCGSTTWTIVDTVTKAVIYSVVLPNPGNTTFVFPSMPGVYRVTINTCQCICNKMCCKNRSVLVQIPANPLLAVIKDPQTGDIYRPNEGGGTYNPLEENGDSPEKEEDGASPHLDGKVMRLVPNPTSSEFRIVIDGLNAQVYDAVQILAADGKVVNNFTFMEAGHVYHLHVAPGSYTVRVQVKDERFDTKLIIQQ